MRQGIFVGALLAGLAVALGAFGAHILKPLLSAKAMAIYHKASYYQMVHALALIAVGVLQRSLPPNPLLTWSAWSFLVGILLFSGSLYLLSLTGLTWLGIITPVGGVAFLLGWGTLAWAARPGNPL